MTAFTNVAPSGFQIFPDVVDAAGIESLIADLPLLADYPETKQRDGQIYGARNLLRLLPSVNQLAIQSPFADLANRILNASAFPVQAIFFDKVPGAKWEAGWH